MEASRARKASSKACDFERIDFPEVDPPEWDKYVIIKRGVNGEVEISDKPYDYWLKEPYASNYRENYDSHNGLDENTTRPKLEAAE